MEVAYYNLSGGINQSTTKTELGLNTKKVYWSDSENVEILQNKGIIKQKGNMVLLSLPEEEAITGMHQFSADDTYKLIITTASGKIYIYNRQSGALTRLEKTLSGKKPVFVSFLNGVVANTEQDALFYIKNNENYDIEDCNLKNSDGEYILGGAIAIFRGRVWVAKDSTLYYSALGTYNDFSTPEDAGYISDFHTDTFNIIALKGYKDYLAIYKKDMVYLLSGITPADFAIQPFANKGCYSPKGIVNVNNKQYFLSNGIFPLQQSELNQIQLGSEITTNIKEEFEKFDTTRMEEMFCLHYESKNQIWYFFPYTSNEFFQTIWINDYANKSWYKRVLPQKITTAAIFNGEIITADNKGNIYIENKNNTFNGEPIKFMWKSPFFSIGNAFHRKMIDEFYFILDEEYDNNFNFTVYKDYDTSYADDPEKIYAVHFEHFIWADDDLPETMPCCWAKDEDTIPVWSVNRNTIEKAEISESNYSIQLCVSGSELTHSCAIIGLQFREIYNDD